MALTDNLVAYWKLEEASGTRVDEVGANDLTDNNTVTSNPGKLGDGAQLTAANSEFLSIADNADLSVEGVDFTIAAWVYLDTAGAVTIASKFSTEWWLRADGVSKFQFFTHGLGLSVEAATFGAYSTATWYYVVAWHDRTADTINICVNDSAVDSTATSGTEISASADPVYIGLGGALFNGRIDSVGFWKRVLTSGEITQLYNSGAGLEYPFSAGVSVVPVLRRQYRGRVS